MPAGAVYLTVERSETDFSLSEHILHSFSIIIFSIVIKESVMSTRYAVLCGSAPEDFRQKKLVEMHDFLVSAEGGSWQEDEILEFPNGVHELMLEYALGGVIRSGVDEVLLYICTETPVADSEATVWLGGQEIRKDVLACYAEDKMGTHFQMVYDSCRQFVHEEELGYEKYQCEERSADEQ